MYNRGTDLRKFKQKYCKAKIPHINLPKSGYNVHFVSSDKNNFKPQSIHLKQDTRTTY